MSRLAMTMSLLFALFACRSTLNTGVPMKAKVNSAGAAVQGGNEGVEPVRIVKEEQFGPGDNERCPHGGKLIKIGLDRNLDGDIKDKDELEDEVIECDKAPERQNCCCCCCVADEGVKAKYGIYGGSNDEERRKCYPAGDKNEVKTHYATYGSRDRDEDDDDVAESVPICCCVPSAGGEAKANDITYGSKDRDEDDEGAKQPNNSCCCMPVDQNETKTNYLTYGSKNRDDDDDAKKSTCMCTPMSHEQKASNTAYGSKDKDKDKEKNDDEDSESPRSCSCFCPTENSGDSSQSD